MNAPPPDLFVASAIELDDLNKKVTTEQNQKDDTSILQPNGKTQIVGSITLVQFTQSFTNTVHILYIL